MSAPALEINHGAVQAGHSGAARRWAWCGGAALLLGLGFLGGAAFTSPTDGAWQTGKGFVGDEIMTIESDGVTYGVKDSVETWWDAQGRRHSGGWPSCLTTGLHEVRFVATRLDVDGVETRAIVAVDCRP